MSISEPYPELDELLADKGVVADSHAGDGSVSYAGGTRLEFPGVNIKMNLQLQHRYTYEDFDTSEATGRDDVSSFENRRVRL